VTPDAKALAALAKHDMPDAGTISIEGIERAASGNSSENWFFEAAWRRGDGVDERHRLVLRRTPENEIVRNSRIDEFRLLQTLGSTGLPVPRVFWIDPDGRWLGRPSVVLERCPGRDDRALLTARNREGLPEEARLGIAGAMVELLAAVHRLDPDALDLPASVRRGAGDPAAIELDKQVGEMIDAEVEPAIELRAAAWWLRDNLPGPPVRKALVHGDFRPANLLIEEGRITTLLDWEFAHVGDPAEDIGWFLAPRYAHEHFIQGRWEPDDFLGGYERATGRPLDRRAVRYWAIFAQYKLCCMVLASLRAFAGGDAERIAARPAALLTGLLRAIDAEERSGGPA
jgi:aminoglycoside phosphotransferase (APT) family kinase protein